jgi:hypothetical protein
MKKIMFVVTMALFAQSFAHAANRLVVGNIPVKGSNVVITADAPVKDGGQIGFSNIRAESQGKVYRLTGNSQKALQDSFCQNVEFKYFYANLESGKSSEEAIDLLTAAVDHAGDSAVISNVFCMENMY